MKILLFLGVLSALLMNQNVIASSTKKVCKNHNVNITKLRKLGYKIIGNTYKNNQKCVELILPTKPFQSIFNKANNKIKTDSNAPDTAPHDYKVYDDFDKANNHNGNPLDDGIRAQLYNLANSTDDYFELKVLGHSHQNREIIAINITDKSIHSKKGEALLVGLHHALEWTSTDSLMRFLYHIKKQIAANNQQLLNLLKEVEIWIVPVLNPDGYQYTFSSPYTSWRKNLRDNNNNGVFDPDVDGVDLNRNYSYLWGMDEWGASSNPAYWNYRGPSPFSEPETQALKGLIDNKNFTHMISYHSYGNLILYPSGSIPFTRTADHPMYKYLAGTEKKSAIYDSHNKSYYKAILSSMLYTTNGAMTDWAYNEKNALAFTVELTSGENGHRYPDDEKLLNILFKDNLPFMMDIIKSAATPETPSSHLNKKINKIHHENIQKSYGHMQEFEVFVPKGSISKLYFFDGEESKKKMIRFTPNTNGVYFQKQITRIKFKNQSIKYYIQIERNGDTIRYPKEGLIAYQIKTQAKKPILLINAEAESSESFPLAVNKYIASLNNIGLEGKFDTYIKTPGESLKANEILNHYDLIIYFSGDNLAPFSKDSGFHFSDYLRNTDGNLIMSSYPLKSFDDESKISQFFGHFMGLQNVFPGFISLFSFSDTIQYISKEDDPIFKGMDFEIKQSSSNISKALLNSNTMLPNVEVASTIKKGPYITFNTEGHTKYQHSYMEVDLEIPQNQDNILTLKYFDTLYGTLSFLEVYEPTTTSWTCLKKREPTPDRHRIGHWVRPEDVKEVSHLKYYYNEDASEKLDEEGIPLFQEVLKNKYASPLTYDLSSFAGQTIKIRFSIISFNDKFWGYEDFIMPGMGFNMHKISPEEFKLFGDLKMNKETDAYNRGASLLTDRTLYFSFALEDITEESKRDEILKNSINHFLGI